MAPRLSRRVLKVLAALVVSQVADCPKVHLESRRNLQPSSALTVSANTAFTQSSAAKWHPTSSKPQSVCPWAQSISRSTPSKWIHLMRLKTECQVLHPTQQGSLNPRVPDHMLPTSRRSSSSLTPSRILSRARLEPG